MGQFTILVRFLNEDHVRTYEVEGEDLTQVKDDFLLSKVKGYLRDEWAIVLVVPSYLSESIPSLKYTMLSDEDGKALRTFMYLLNPDII